MSVTHYLSTGCQKKIKLNIDQTITLQKPYDFSVQMTKQYSLAWIVISINTVQHLFIFSHLPDFLIDCPVNYHQWIWEKPSSYNLILLPNLLNNPEYYYPIRFKPFSRVQSSQLSQAQPGIILPNINYLLNKLQFKFFVDVQVPITIYDSKGSVVLGQNHMDNVYLNESGIINLTETYYISCNDVISRMTQPIIRILIWVYDSDQSQFLFSDQMIFRIAPIILTPSCLSAETIYLSKMKGLQNNEVFLKQVSSILTKEKKKFVIIDNPKISMKHRWLRDILNFGYVNDGEKYTHLILKGPNFSTQQKNTPSYIEQYFKEYPLYDLFFEQKRNLDAFGNVLVSPPVYPDYPLGRIVHGISIKGEQPNMSFNLIDLLESQQVQKPVKLETGWLRVGHVDEIISFIPDRGSQSGFRLLIASVNKFFDLISKLDPQTVIFDNNELYYTFHYQYDSLRTRLNPKFNGNEPHKSCIYKSQLRVKDLLEWPELLRDNYQYQEILDSNKQILLKELQLKTTDVYEVPICFWPKSISERAKSIIPNMVNSLYTNQFMLVPKPFGPSVKKHDLFEDYFRSIIPKNIRTYFIKNWDSYYLLDGDIHCGTNVKRIQFKRKWWSHMPSSSYDILA